MVLLGWWSLVGCTECPDATTTSASADAGRCSTPLTDTDLVAPPPDPVDTQVTDSLPIRRPMIDLLVVVDSTHDRSPEVLDALREELVDLGALLTQRDLDVHYGLLDSLGGLDERPLGVLDTITDDPAVLVGALDTLPPARDSGYVRSAIFRALELKADENAPFRRADAALEVIVASPRDDRSTAPDASEFTSWLIHDPRRGGTAHGMLPTSAASTLEFVDQTDGQHVWPFEVQPPPGWSPTGSGRGSQDPPGEPWVPPDPSFELSTLVAHNPPPRLYLSEPPADPARIDATIQRSFPEGVVQYGVLVCTEATQTPDCFLQYEPTTNSLEWLASPAHSGGVIHLTYDRRDATP